MTEYLIIGGSTKCATTSLFNYLSDHPKICPCQFKESRFFLHPDYPLPCKVPLSESLHDYNNLFRHCDNKAIKLEATPDYLYSENTEEKINHILHNFKLLFILRNPVNRFISWYNFSKQVNLLESSTTFEQYLNVQLKNEIQNSQHLLALQHGRYINYLRNYFNTISKENIEIIIYEQLIENPKDTMIKLCSKLEIDPTFYNSYSFNVYNPSLHIKNKLAHQAFLKTKRFIRKSLKHAPFNIKNKLKTKTQSFQDYYLQKNTEQIEQNQISKHLLNSLNNYYTKSNMELEELLKLKLNWN